MITLDYVSLSVGDYLDRMDSIGELPIRIYLEDVFELIVEKADKAPFNMINANYDLKFLDKIKKPNIKKESVLCSNSNLSDVVNAILNENQVLGIVSSLGIHKRHDLFQKDLKF